MNIILSIRNIFFEGRHANINKVDVNAGMALKIVQSDLESGAGLCLSPSTPDEAKSLLQLFKLIQLHGIDDVNKRIELCSKK